MPRAATIVARDSRVAQLKVVELSMAEICDTMAQTPQGPMGEDVGG
jgi:hypothetical protein